MKLNNIFVAKAYKCSEINNDSNVFLFDGNVIVSKALTKKFVDLKTGDKYSIISARAEVGDIVIDPTSLIPYSPSLDEERTLAIIKPDGLKHTDKIIDMIYENGLRIAKYDVRLLDEDILSEHYSHLIDKPFYPTLRDYMMSGPVAVMVLEGTDAVNKFRTLMGPTDASKAPKNTIRGLFGTDITRNAVHGSDSKENAEIEINRFFKVKQKTIRP